MSPAQQRIANIDAELLLAFVMSLLLHAALFVVLTRRPSLPASLPIFDVDLVVQPRPAPPALPVSRQIVTPPDAGRGKQPAAEPPFTSDVASAAEVEQIRRGDGLDAGPRPGSGPSAGGRAASAPAAPPARPSSAERPAPPAAAPRKAAGGRPAEPETGLIAKQLDLSPDYKLLSRLGTEGKHASPPSAAAARGSAPEPEPFSRTPGSGARIIGFNGMSDHLPGIRDGDITLLNAKADKFGVFVRRVAPQVFNLLKQQGWETLQARDIQSIRDFTTVRACLSPQGKLLTVELLAGSASTRFDNMVQQSVRNGARDPHPPAAARAADGNFYFIFMAKSWVRAYSDPRGGGFGEQRWLLLKTGLE